MRNEVQRAAKAVALICILTARSASGQGQARVTFGGDSAARLSAGLSSKGKEAFTAYPTSPDSTAWRPLSTLMEDSGAAVVLFVLLARDPSPWMRESIMRGLSSPGPFVNHP